MSAFNQPSLASIQPKFSDQQQLHADTRRTASGGLQTTGGYIHLNYGDPILRGQRAMRVFLEMGDDPTAGVLLYLMNNITAGVDWDVREFSDDPADVENAQFLKTCMQDMGQTWADFVGNCVNGIIQFGFSPYEQVYKVRDGRMPKNPDDEPSKYSDGKIGWADFQCIGQDTITRWDFDQNNRVLGVWQQAAPTFQSINIPAVRLINFRRSTFRDNPMGESIFRRAYSAFRQKKALEAIEGIAIERDLCGLPVIHAPLSVLQTDASPQNASLRQSFEKMVRDLRTDEQMGVVFPSVIDPETKQDMYRLELLNSGGTRSIDVSKVIERYNTEIFRTALADFLGIGSTTNTAGSYSAHQDKTQLFLMGLRSYLKVVCETLNRVAIPRLFAINGVEAKGYPEIYHTPIDQVDIAQMATAIQALAGAGMSFFPNEEIERRILEIIGLPASVNDANESKKQELEVNTAVSGDESRVIRPGDNVIASGKTNAVLEKKPTPTPTPNVPIVAKGT